ncbi:DNA-formamidopyrimidine glycosylase family protein [Microbacterium sp. NPDC091313]
MPEGDSVYRLARRLEAASAGHVVRSGELRSGGAAGRRLDGMRIESFDTRGKHLLTRFSGGESLHTHLRMQGSWTVTAARRMPPRAVVDTVRVRMQLADGRTVWGIDLPVVELVPTDAEGAVLAHLGPDPLRADWDADEAVRRLRRAPARPLVAALLDQRNLAGLGNLWVNEVAFLRGIHPFAPVGGVDLPPLVALAARMLRISATVPAMYQVTTGRARAGESHWVAGRAGRPCLRCGTTVLVRAERRGDPEQRRTWWCPRCQPESPSVKV